MAQVGDRFDVLPGRAASAWKRYADTMILVGAVTTLLFFVGLAGVFGPASAATAAALVATVGLSITSSVLRTIASRREQHESAAGYTTLANTHRTVDQVDEVTGLIVRTAGMPFIGGTSTGSDPEIEVPSKRPGYLRRYGVITAVAIGPFVMISFAAVISVWARNGPVEGWAVTPIPLVFIAGYVALVAIVSALQYFGRRRMRASHPGAFYFTFRSSLELRSALRRLDLSGPHGAVLSMLDRTSFAAVDTNGITIWSTSRQIPILVIGWEQTVSFDRSELPMAIGASPEIVSLRVRIGMVDAELPLVDAHADSVPLPSRAETRWVADELRRQMLALDPARRP